MTVTIIEMSHSDYPEMTTIIEVFNSTEKALEYTKQLVQDDMDSMGEDEEIICKQVGPDQYKLNYKGSLNDWFVTVYNPK